MCFKICNSVFGEYLSVCSTGTDGEVTEASVPAKPAKAPHWRRKKGKRGRKPGPKPKQSVETAADLVAAAGPAAAEVNGILELDTDFVLTSSMPDSEVDVIQLPGWACPAGRVRLLARMQARESAAAAQASGAEALKEEQLAAQPSVMQTEQKAEVLSKPAEEAAAAKLTQSIAGAKYLFAEFESLHTKILGWA